MSYYILSLKHTSKSDEFITLWGPNNSGYCFAKKRAGLYEEIEHSYHDRDYSLPVPEEVLENLFINALYGNERNKMVPNIASVHRELGIKWKKGELVKI